MSGPPDAGRVLPTTVLPGEEAAGIMTAADGAIVRATGLRGMTIAVEAMPTDTTRSMVTGTMIATDEDSLQSSKRRGPVWYRASSLITGKLLRLCGQIIQRSAEVALP
jgi:hypothetical protein